MAGMVRSLCLCWRLVRASAVVMMTGKLCALVRDEWEKHSCISYPPSCVQGVPHQVSAHITDT